MSHAPHIPDTHAPADPEQRRSWSVMILALVAQVLVVLDISVVNTAMPVIGHDLAWPAATCSGW